jgi:DNA-binding IscR family transcriptional regulator
VDCSLRSLWRSLQLVLDQVLDKTSLRDLLCNETEMTTWIGHLVSVAPANANARA